MQHGATLPRQFAEQRQRDHALAAPRATGDDDDSLGVGRPSPLHLMHDDVEGEPLLIKEHELLSVSNRLRRNGKQLPAGRGRHPEQLVCRVRA